MPLMAASTSVQSCSDHIAAFDQRCSSALNDFLFPLTLPYLGLIGVFSGWQVGKGGEYALQFQQVIVACGKLFLYLCEDSFQEQRPGTRGQRIERPLTIQGKDSGIIYALGSLGSPVRGQTGRAGKAAGLCWRARPWADSNRYRSSLSNRSLDHFPARPTTTGWRDG